METRTYKYAGYPEPLKRSLVARLLAPGGPTAYQLAVEVGINRSTLCEWVRQYGSSAPMSEPKERTPNSWSAREKFRAVVETAKMDEQTLGTYLRTNGLHAAELEKWRTELEAELDPKSAGQERRAEWTALQKENKDLKREIRRKDKALAEASALLILKKKAEILFGEFGDDEQD